MGVNVEDEEDEEEEPQFIQKRSSMHDERSSAKRKKVEILDTKDEVEVEK